MIMEAAEQILKEIPREAGEVLRITLSEFKGRKLLNIRIWYTDQNDGQLKPTKKGVTVNGAQYADFLAAIQAAQGKFE